MGRPIPFLSREQIAELRTMEGPSSRPHGAPGTAMRHVRKDGSHVDTLFSTGVLRDAAGVAAGYIAVITDLTEHKLLEAQLRQAQKMEAVGQLAGGVAHDFNNLLTVIKAHTFIALEGLPEDAPAREDLVAVNDAAGRAADLTRRLLAFSRKQLLQPRVLDLNAAMSGVLPMLQRLIGEDIEVVTQLDPSLHTVSADPAQLEQVIMNLAVNARDAMPHGGVFRIATGNVELREARVMEDGFTMQPGSYVVLEVGDTGVGMDAATRQRIFEPFFTTKEQGKGTGLGLAMVYGIVKQSGGYVRVESVPGKGARFEIWLPRAESGEQRPPRFERAAAPRRGTETVLVVEDEEAVRHVVRRVLELQGYTVHAARDGAEALHVARAQEGRIDLVMTDVILPEMSGPAIVERLLAEWPHAKVLYMSGYAAEEAAKRGLLVPGTALLKKPFTLDDLALAVRGVLDAQP
jgi:signal transduction histidine kinase/ActR/RegA family two-component response regulator